MSPTDTDGRSNLLNMGSHVYRFTPCPLEWAWPSLLPSGAVVGAVSSSTQWYHCWRRCFYYGRRFSWNWFTGLNRWIAVSFSEPCGTQWTVTIKGDKWPPGWRPLHLWAVQASPFPSSRHPRNLPPWLHPSPNSTLINRLEIPTCLTLQVTTPLITNEPPRDRRHYYLTMSSHLLTCV